jgi:hypothetical protein
MNLLFSDVNTDVEPELYLQAVNPAIKLSLLGFIQTTPKLDSKDISLISIKSREVAYVPGMSRQDQFKSLGYNRRMNANGSKQHVMEQDKHEHPRRLATKNFDVTVLITAVDTAQQTEMASRFEYINSAVGKADFVQDLNENHAHCPPTPPALRCPPLGDVFLTPIQFTMAQVVHTFTSTTTTTGSTTYVYPIIKMGEDKLDSWVITLIWISASFGLCLCCISACICAVYFRSKTKVIEQTLEAEEADEAWKDSDTHDNNLIIMEADMTTPLTGHTFQEWQGGGTYSGQVVKGFREGNGRMEWPNGKTFTGQWQGGRPHGHGLWYVPGDTDWVYNGQFQNGQRHGIGRFESLARGMWYDGNWDCGVQFGMGESGQLDEPHPQNSLVAPPAAYLWWVEKGEQKELISISRVADEVVEVTLEATPADSARISKQSEPALVLGQMQFISRPWGICVGTLDRWLPSSWGALILTRIIEDSPMGRWNNSQGQTVGGRLPPNCLIWSVNGVSGDVNRMLQELCHYPRAQLRISVSCPAHIRYSRQTGLVWGQRPDRSNLPALPSGFSDFASNAYDGGIANTIGPPIGPPPPRRPGVGVVPILNLPSMSFTRDAHATMQHLPALPQSAPPQPGPPRLAAPEASSMPAPTRALPGDMLNMRSQEANAPGTPGSIGALAPRLAPAPPSAPSGGAFDPFAGFDPSKNAAGDNAGTSRGVVADTVLQVMPAPPMSSALVTGVDMNRDGIPDFLQHGQVFGAQAERDSLPPGRYAMPMLSADSHGGQAMLPQRPQRTHLGESPQRTYPGSPQRTYPGESPQRAFFATRTRPGEDSFVQPQRAQPGENSFSQGGLPGMPATPDV